MNKTDLLKSMLGISRKGAKYSLYRAIVNSLNEKELIGFFCKNYDQLSTTELSLFVDRLVTNHLTPTSSQKLFSRISKAFAKTENDYRRNSTYGKFLTSTARSFPVNAQRQIVELLLKSRFRLNNRRAFNLIKYCMCWDDSLTSLVEKSWARLGQFEALEVIVRKFKTIHLERLSQEITPYFDEYEIEYDFELKKLRNYFYSRMPKKFSTEIEKLKSSDPVSYIFICKESKTKIPTDYVVQVYKGDSRAQRYLPKWLIEMDQLDTIEELTKLP